MSATDAIVWVDCEMTGLDLSKDALVEIAVVVTDSQLSPVGPGLDLVIAPPPGVVDTMLPVVHEMHTKSGLLEDLPNGIPLAEAEEQALDYVRQFVPEPRKAPLAGNSVGTDKTFLDRDMPDFVGHLHYRIIDVSSIKGARPTLVPARVLRGAEEGRRPPRPGGHPREHRRAALLPLHPVPRRTGSDSATARRTAAEVLAHPTVLTPLEGVTRATFLRPGSDG